jgi:hypothetical protein
VDPLHHLLRGGQVGQERIGVFQFLPTVPSGPDRQHSAAVSPRAGYIVRRVTDDEDLLAADFSPEPLGEASHTYGG